MPGKFPNIWKLNNTLLNNTYFKEVSREILKYFELNENETSIYKNLWDAMKVVLRGKFLALNAYIKKKEISEIDNLCFHLRKLEKESKLNPQYIEEKK